MEGFTIAEKNLLCIFEDRSRRGVVADLQSILPYLDEKDMQELAQSVIEKLEGMTDKEFVEEMFRQGICSGNLRHHML